MKKSLLSLAAAFSLWSVPGIAADTIKIGAFLSVTGPASFLGDPEKKVLDHYVAEINKAGGIKGRRVELIAYDDAGAAEKAVSFAKRLIQNDGVDVIIGGTTTAATMAAIPLIEAEGVPFISLAGAVVVVDPVKKWVFKTSHTDRMAADRIMEDLKKRGLLKLALVSEDSAFGKSGRAQTLESAKVAGIEIVADETYGAKDTDVTAQLTKVKASGSAQAVLVFGLGQGPAVVTRAYRQIGMTIPLYQSHGVASKEYITLAGPAAEGVRLPATGLVVVDQIPANDPQKPVVAAFNQTYRKLAGGDASVFAGYAYDALQLVVGAIEKTGSTDKAAVRDAIERTAGYMGTSGIVSMTPADHMGLTTAGFRMVEIRNGDWQLLP